MAEGAELDVARVVEVVGHWAPVRFRVARPRCFPSEGGSKRVCVGAKSCYLRP